MSINRPESLQKTFRLVIALAIVAWAAQAVFAQERFVPSSGSSRSGLSTATLELRGEATVVGADVKLKQVCRWSDGDAAAFEPIADLVVVRMGQGTPYRAIRVSELKQTMQDAGVNLAFIKFAGTTQCTITRSDVSAAGDERASLDEWVNARTKPATTQPAKASAVSVTPSEGSLARTAAAVTPAHLDGAAPSAKDEAKQYHTLRELLAADLAERLSLSPDALQLHFNPVDDKVLNLSEPQFRFNCDGQRIHNLGNVSWQVTIVADGGASQKTSVNAIARAWQDQLLVRKPMAARQTIQADDLVSRRVLVEQLPDDAPVAREQVVGQLTSRDLKPGSVLTPRLVEAAPLAQIGDLITVAVEQGKVQITTIGRAMEFGTFGQTIKVKNETTGSVYEVTLVGPKKGKMSGGGGRSAPDQATATIAN